MLKQTLILLLTLFTGFVMAQEDQGQDTQQPALVDIKVGIELTKIEQSMKNIDQSIKQASKALQEMAKHPNIEPEQQLQITNTFKQLDKLALTFQRSIEQLPTAIQKSTPPITSVIDKLFSNVQQAILLVLIAIVVIILFALLAIYFWILKPSGEMLLKTTSKVDNMATALQTTAEIVDKTTQQQLLILNYNSVKRE